MPGVFTGGGRLVPGGFTREGRLVLGGFTREGRLVLGGESLAKTGIFHAATTSNANSKLTTTIILFGILMPSQT
jgi:hypothetical protein